MRNIETFDAQPANENSPSRLSVLEAEYRALFGENPRDWAAARRAFGKVESKPASDSTLRAARMRLDAHLRGWENAIAVRLAENFLASAQMHIEAGILAVAAQDKNGVARHFQSLFDQCTSPEAPERQRYAAYLWRQALCLAYHAGNNEAIHTIRTWAEDHYDPPTLAASIVALHDTEMAERYLQRWWRDLMAQTEVSGLSRELHAALMLANHFPDLHLSAQVKMRAHDVSIDRFDRPMIEHPLDPRAYLPMGEAWPETRELTPEDERMRLAEIRRLLKEVRDKESSSSEHWSEDLQTSFIHSHGLDMLHAVYPIASKMRR